MKQQAYFVITRLHRDDLKSQFPDIPEERIDALSDEAMESIAHWMHEADLAGDFWDRLELVAEELLVD
jgi:hypothetical protein